MSSISSTLGRWCTPTCNFSSRVSNALCWPPHELHSHAYNKHTNKHNKNKIKSSKNNGKHDDKIYLNWRLHFKPRLCGYHLLLSLLFAGSLLQCDVSCADFTIYQQKHTFNGKHKHQVLTGISIIDFYEMQCKLIASVLCIVTLKIPAI